MTTKGRGKRWQHLKKLAQAKAPARVQGMCAFGMVMRGSWRDSARRCVSAAAQPPGRGPGRARPWAVLEVSPPPAGTAGQGPPRTPQPEAEPEPETPQPEAEPEPEAEPDGTVVSRDTHHSLACLRHHTFVSRVSSQMAMLLWCSSTLPMHMLEVSPISSPASLVLHPASLHLRLAHQPARPELGCSSARWVLGYEAWCCYCLFPFISFPLCSQIESELALFNSSRHPRVLVGWPLPLGFGLDGRFLLA